MYSLNSGADYQSAGPLHLAGGVSSYRTPLPQDISTFDEFKVSWLNIQFEYIAVLNVFNLQLLVIVSLWIIV